jgi:ubiquinol-cytochrome c reductase cytochrome b subunit
VAFWVARRVCLGLQRRDAQTLEHGLETGIIRQLPNGAFVEDERPLTEEESAAMVAKPQALPLPAPDDVDENGLPVPGSRGLAGRVRARVNAMWAEGVSLAPPDGHGNGHGRHEEPEEHEAMGSQGEHATIGGGPAEVEEETRPEDRGE